MVINEKLTIDEKVIKSLENIQIGSFLTRKEIIDIAQEKFPNTNPKSIIPSDYCYNRVNKGDKFPLFRWVKKGVYEYLGQNYKYSGDIFWLKKGIKEINMPKIGYWENGKRTIFDEY